MHTPDGAKFSCLEDFANDGLHIGGQVQVMFALVPGALEYVRTGILRALAVTTASQSPGFSGN
jgi:hypothetical protein